MAKRLKKRESRYDEYLGIPVEADLKKEIAQVAKSEERDPTSMARLLLKEALSARNEPVARSAAE